MLRRRERGQLAQEHMRTHTQRQWLTPVKSECMMINPSAHGYSMKLCINYRNDSIPKPPCWNGSQRTTLEQLVTCQRSNLLHTWDSCKVKATPTEHSRVMYRRLSSARGKAAEVPQAWLVLRWNSHSCPIRQISLLSVLGNPAKKICSQY